MRAAGGILGFLASSPLAAAVSTYGALALLVLLGLFGLLVITATPVNMIPERMRQLRALVIHREGDDGADELDAPAAAVKRARRKPVDLAERDGDEAFRQAAQKASEDSAKPRPGEKRATAAGVLAPRPGGQKAATSPSSASSTPPTRRPSAPPTPARSAPRPSSSRRPCRSCRPGSSSSASAATSPTAFPTRPC